MIKNLIERYLVKFVGNNETVLNNLKNGRQISLKIFLCYLIVL